MDGMTCLEQKLMEMGFNKHQVKAKIVSAVVSAIAEDGGLCLEHCRQIDKLHEQAEYMKKNAANLQERAKWVASDAHELQRLAEKQLAKAQEMKRTALEELETFEMPEMRDRYRMARLFCDKTEARVKTVYDTTAFIKGLAAIMGGMKEAEENDTE